MLGLFRRKKSKPKKRLSRSEFLRIRPVRNEYVNWKKDDEGVVEISIPLEQPIPGDKVMGKIMSKLIPESPKEKKIKLDKIGSKVWELCDGKRTVKEIIDALNREYKMMPIEAEASLRVYFGQLAKRGLIGMLPPEDVERQFKQNET